MQEDRENGGLESPITRAVLDEAMAKRILETQEPCRDPNIYRTAKGFFDINPTPFQSGGWGTVHTARFYSLEAGQLKISQPIAIKKSQSSSPDQIKKEYELFQQAHPDQYFDYCEKDYVPYLAMPLFPGVPLDRYLLSHSFIPLKERKDMAVELLMDLNEVHKNGVTHHDIKPKNILFDKSNKKMYLLDFGCAELPEKPMKYTIIDSAKYAIEYMPPEYLRGTTTTAANDIYSMTLTIAEILGLNKKELVRERINRALSTIDDQSFKDAITAAFHKYQTLDEVMFSSELGRYSRKPVFETFIQNYVTDQYDFNSYRTKLDTNMFQLLNSMQANDPRERPTVHDCVQQLQTSLGDDLKEAIRQSKRTEGEQKPPSFHQ